LPFGKVLEEREARHAFASNMDVKDPLRECSAKLYPTLPEKQIGICFKEAHLIKVPEGEQDLSASAHLA